MATLAVAQLTLRNTLRQPLTWLVTGVGGVLIMLSFSFGMFTWDSADRVNLLATAGVASTVLTGLFLGIVLASQAIHDELSSRTALTLFAKPMPRYSFLLGKIIGVWFTVLASMLIITTLHFIALRLALLRGFELDGHEALVDWFSWRRIAAAHLLGLMANGIMITISAVLALRVPLAVNILVCFAIFVLAHLTGPILGTGGALVLPPLHLYAIDDSLAFIDMRLTWRYLCLSLGSALFYASACICLGVALFRRQDIP